MSVDQTRTINDQPAYLASEAARILVVPASTVKAWSFGQKHQDGRPGRFRPVFAPADTRRRHRVSLPTVRDSLAYVRKELKVERPLIAQEFLTDGIDLFIHHAGQLLNTNTRQQGWRGDFENAMLRIEWNPQGAPIRLFPFTRSSRELSDQPRSVVIDPKLSFGRPVLARAGVTTDVVQDRFNAGDSPEEMAEDYGVGTTDILEAIRFERYLAAA